jgi:aldose 1-epimerase
MFEVKVEHLYDGIKFTKVILKRKLEVLFSTVGASIFEIKLSDKTDKMENILITPSRKDWLEKRTYAGSIVGPLAGRYGVENTDLEQNRFPIHFHGGSDGWDKIIWNQSYIETHNKVTIAFSYETPNYAATISYSVDTECKISMQLDVCPKADMYINPTNHMYFNLNGSPLVPITNHIFQLDAAYAYAEKNSLIQPNSLTKLTQDLDFQDARDLKMLFTTQGLNHTFKLNSERKGLLQHPSNGRKISFETSLPSVVIYTFNVAQEPFSQESKLYPVYSGITFETQYPANDLAKVSFSPQNPYHSLTTFQFYNR